jgi:hypothetical protein
MRLSNIERGRGLSAKLTFVMIRLLGGMRAPDVVRTLVYRKPFFGAPHSDLTQQVMRGPSDWSLGDRELMAAYVSKLNQCSF